MPSGFDVGLLARSSGTVEPVARELGGVRTAVATADVADEPALQGGLEHLVESLGVPEVLVHDAGVIRADDVSSLDATTVRDTWAVNVGGAVTTAATLLARMAEAGGGSHLTTSGMPEPLPRPTSLSLGKAELRALAELLDRQFGPHDVRCATVTVCGPVAPGTAYDPDDIAEHYASLHGRPARGRPTSATASRPTRPADEYEGAPMPTFPAIHHLALSVTDLEVSEPWYTRLIGAEPAMTLVDGPFHRRVFALPSGQLLGLTRHDAADSAQSFSASMPGMDHVGFGAADRAELEQWIEHLDGIGVAHSGIVEAEYGLALSFKDPDGNALEFFVMAG